MSAYTEDKAHGFSQPDFVRLLNRQIHFLNARMFEIFQSICSVVKPLLPWSRSTHFY